MKAPKRFSLHRIIHNQQVAGWLFSGPFIFGFLSFTIIPMLISIYYSFTDFTNFGSPHEVSFLGFANYIKLLKDDRFHNSLRVTLYYVAFSVPLKLAFALLVAYFLTRKTKAAPFYRSLYYIPSLIGGSIAVSLVWKELFSRQGLVNQLFDFVGLGKQSWFGNPNLTIHIFILMSVWQFGSSMIIFAAGLKEIPFSYYEAAYIDGANKRQTFRKITLPCLSPIILYNLIMQTIAGFMLFTQAFVISNGKPNDSTNFYALYVYRQGFTYNNMSYASAMSWIMLIIMITITGVILKTSKKWVFTEA